MTGREEEEVIVALHDCDGDSNKATLMLFEGGNDQVILEWFKDGRARLEFVPLYFRTVTTSNNKKIKRELQSLEYRWACSFGDACR